MAGGIVFLLPSFAAGGAQKVMLMLASALDRPSWRPKLIVFNSSGPWRNRIPANLQVISLERATLRAALPHLLRVLRRDRPASIVSTLAYVNIGICMLAPLLGYRPRILVREANMPERHARSVLGQIGYRLGYWLSYRRADVVICPSQQLADELTTNFGVRPNRIVVMPNPIDEASLRGLASSPQRLAGSGRRFVAVGRLTKQKGYDRLLDDFAQLADNSVLMIMGEGEEREALQGCIQRLGLSKRVRLAGFEGNPAPWIAGADALLLPSRWEGLPNVALEALACGTPVIATPEAGGISEIAAAAMPDAVTLASAGADFVSAMLKVAPRPDVTLRPSLLPNDYRLTLVLEKFAALLAA